MRDIITDFVTESHAEKGPRSELKMRKEFDGAGFCIRAKGGKNNILIKEETALLSEKAALQGEGNGK